MEQQDTRPAALLLDQERKKALTYLDPSVVNAFASEYAEADEFEDNDLRRYLDENLIAAMSRKGFRSNQIVEMATAKEAQRIAQERYMNPSFTVNTGSQPQRKGGLFGRR